MPRKKNRKGRPRAQNVVREPNGRASRRLIDVDDRRKETIKETRAVATEARKRLHRLSDDDAASDRAGYELGRLRLSRQISEIELEAGNRFALDAARYYRLTGIPFPSVRSNDLGAAAGRSLLEPSPEDVKAAANRWMGLQGCIGIFDKPGRPVLTTLMHVCVRDLDTTSWPPHMMGFLHKGLCALVEFYGIEAQDVVDTRGKAA